MAMAFGWVSSRFPNRGWGRIRYISTGARTIARLKPGALSDWALPFWTSKRFQVCGGRCSPTPKAWLARHAERARPAPGAGDELGEGNGVAERAATGRDACPSRSQL